MTVKPKFPQVDAVKNWPLALAELELSTGSPIPLYEQISRALRNAILSGDLPSGTLLPNSRELAKSLHVGRNTIVTAFSRLAAEGYLVSNTRRGTRVAPHPDANLADAGDAADLSAPATPPNISFQAGEALDHPLTFGEGYQPFSLHRPDPSLSPRERLGRLLNEEFRRPVSGELGERIREGQHPIQAAIAAHLRQMRGINCRPEQVIPAASVEMATNLAVRTLIDPGHCTYVQDPSPDSARSFLRAAGAKLHPLPLEWDGTGIHKMSAPPPRLIYALPFGFPLGQQLSESSRQALVDFARTRDCVLFESDVYGELLFTGRRLRTLYGIDGGQRVVYMGSLGKTLGPRVNVTYLVVPPALAKAFSGIAQQMASWPAEFILSAVARFIDNHQYAKHTRALRAAYAARMQRVVYCCRHHLPDMTVIEPAGGYHLTLLFKRDVDDIAVKNKALENQMFVAPLSQFYLNGNGPKGLVLGFSTVPDDLVDISIQRLRHIIDQVKAPSPDVWSGRMDSNFRLQIP